MMRVRLLLAVLLAVVGFSSLAMPASAAGACYCSITKVGASQTAATDASSCQTACSKAAGSVGYMWAADVSQGPSSLLQCWSKAELCEADMDGDGVVDGDFDNKFQPPECPAGWHYCYPNDSIKYNLQVSIPNPDGSATTSVFNYGEYVAVLYRYLIGFAVSVAIVFVMIGGVRYVIGASTGEIGKAKDMITKAITGLVLLMFAYTILYTVNPQLLKLEVPKLPMIRQVQILTGGEDCGSLEDKGYEIDKSGASAGHYGKLFCGSVATVLKDPAGADMKEGITCTYTFCGGQPDQTCGAYKAAANQTAKCVGMQNDYRCVHCGQITPDNGCNITPGAAVCGALEPWDTYVSENGAQVAYDKYNVCGYTHEPSMFSSGGGAAAAMTATVAAGILSGGTAAGVIGAWYTADVALDAKTGSCVDMTIQCQQVNKCTDYNSGSWQVANQITDNELYDLDWAILGDPNIVNVCNADPCGVSKVSGKSGETCTYDESQGNCQSSTYAADQAAAAAAAAAAVECDNPELC